MDKYITGVSYRHAILTAYLKVIGRNQHEAERRAKRVGTVLRKKMPKVAEIGVPRERGFDRKTKTYWFEIPVLIAECIGPAKAALARLVLQGSV